MLNRAVRAKHFARLNHQRLSTRSSSLERSFASAARPGKETKAYGYLSPPVLGKRYLEHSDGSNGPVKNETWAPYGNFTDGVAKKSSTITHNPQRPQPSEAPRIKSREQQQKSRFSTSMRQLQPKIEEDPQGRSTSSSGEGSSGVGNGKSRTDAPSDEAPSRATLPDLRQGIPSTFEQEISDRSSSFKDRETEQPNLNLTEDPTREDQEQNRKRGEGPREAYKSSIERRRETMAFYGFLTAGAMMLAATVTLGQNWDEREARGHPDVPNGWTPGAVYARARARLSEMLGYYTEPAFPKLLPDVDPALRPSPYTLVLSLEDLLVSSKWSRQNGWEVAKRPGLDYFIRYLSQYYELVLFTSVPFMNGEQVYKKMDPFNFIMFPLFREGTRYMNGHHVKDLSYLNRDLSKTIIIDTDANHTQLQPENAVILPKWNGQPRDGHAADLVALIPFLEYIAGMNIEDVRKVIKSFDGKDVPAEYARREALAREAFEKQRQQEGRPKTRSSSTGGLGGMLGFRPGSQLGQLPGEQGLAPPSQDQMIIDQVRARGRIQYEQLERDIRANGAGWLEEKEREEKKFMDEQMKAYKDDWMGWPTKMFGTPSAEGKPADEKR